MLRGGALLVAVLALAPSVAGCSGESEADKDRDGGPAVAVVGGQEIKRDELEASVEHFREEFNREGKSFPAEGTPAFERLEREALDILVYRSELEQAAARIGVTVSEDEVTARMRATGSEEEAASMETTGEAGAEHGREEEVARESAARAQLLLEAVARKLAADVAVTDADVEAYYRDHSDLFAGSDTLAAAAPGIRRQLLSEARNRALDRFLAEMRRSFDGRIRIELGSEAEQSEG